MISPPNDFNSVNGIIDFGEGGMGGVSRKNEFADYRTIGSGVAIMPTASVVIPVKSEVRNLGHGFGTIQGWVGEVALADGHSMDEAVLVAQKLYPAVRIVHGHDPWQGDALQAGFAAKDDVIVMMDADGSTDGREIPRFVAALTTGADFAKGSRFASGGGSDNITFSWFFGKEILRGFVDTFFDTRYSDLCYGCNAFWVKHPDKLDLDCLGFDIKAMMNVRASKAKRAIREISSYEDLRLHGMSNLKIIRGAWCIAKTIIFRERFMSRTAKNAPRREDSIMELPDVRDSPIATLGIPSEALWPIAGIIIPKGNRGNGRPAIRCLRRHLHDSRR